MSATTDHLSPRAVPFRVPTARLALKPVNPSSGHVELDGAWWPRARDLSHELPVPADVLDPHRILLLSCTAGRWDLLVVPAETSAPSAARLTAAASASTAPQSTASDLMTAEQADAFPSYEAAAGRLGRPAAGM
ncbi:hypothetical protein GCM10022403_038820 [Streptomyces coacervatus]|uniref:Uncharacterized protein n=1 Tax=Streptomyces coacervatus TaxID=647381 RepID=A0ABP7HP05_9ACTN|nr:DUF5994 family protein [Streptomyces coacervatus]MDF2270710.1 DUF5994 family protein [Streptomyces coacervatus]